VDSLASGVEEGTSADGTDAEGEVGKERASSELNHERVAEGGGLGTIKSGTINLTQWERRTERVKPSLIQDEVGTNAVPRRNGTVAADSKKIGGLEIQKRASAKPDDRSLVQRRPAVVQFPPVQVQAADVGQGFTNRSPRSRTMISIAQEKTLSTDNLRQRRVRLKRQRPKLLLPKTSKLGVRN